MAPSLRPVLPLCDFTALRWGSSIILRPRHVFHVQRFLSHVRTSEKKEENESSGWSFPRETMPSWAKMWWIFLHVPSLPIGLMRLIGKSLYQSWTLPVVNSRAARLSYVFRSGCLDLLSEVIRPWGFVGRTEGSSMEPTLPAVPALIYASFAYINKTDVKRGDVVVIPPPKPYDDRAGIICKRIAALEGDRIWVNEYGPPRKVSARRVHVRLSHSISLLSSAFPDGHYRYRLDTAFCSGITLETPVTQGHSVRCRLILFWPRCNGSGNGA